MIVAHISGRLPDNFHVGDQFPIHGTARVTGIEEELINASSFTGEEVLLPGSRNYTLWIVLDEYELENL